MARVIGTSTTVVKQKKSPSVGGWLSQPQTRKRKGIVPSANLYNTETPFVDDARPDRYLSDAELWSVYRRTPDVRACIDSIVRRVATFDWTVRPIVDPNSEYYLEAAEISARAQRFMSAPNKNGETWQDIMTAIMTDLLVYDAGVIELAHDSQGVLQELVPLLGSSIRPVMDEHGRLIEYQQENDSSVNPTFKPSELVLFQLFPNNASAGYGNPLIESLINEIITLLRSAEHLMLAYDADEIPPGILVLTGLAGNAAREARADFSNLKGQDSKIRVLTTPDPTGAGAKWVELRRTPKDLEFETLIDQIRRVVWRVFGVMPVEMGASDEMPRATAQVQIDMSSSHLVTPLLEMIQAKINTRILPLVVGDSELARLVTFEFDRGMRPTAEDAQLLAQRNQRLIGIGALTRNEVRKEMGYLPIVNGDVMTVDTAQGPIPLDVLIAEGPVGGLVIEPLDIAPDAGTVSVGPIEDDVAPGEVVTESVDQQSDYQNRDKINMKPPKGIISELKRGLSWHEEGHSGDGLKPATVAWARRLANGEDITRDKVIKMRAWLARHEVDKKGKGFYPAQVGYPSPGRVAWALWGGDPAVTWSNKLVLQLEAQDKRSINNDVDQTTKTFGYQIRKASINEFEQDLPSEWQPEGKFSSYRSMDLNSLGWTTINYKRAVTPFWIEAKDAAMSVIGAYYIDGSIDQYAAPLVQRELAKVIDKLVLQWSIVTRPLYREAASISQSAVVEYAGQDLFERWDERADMYGDEAMFWLANPEGMLGVIKTELMLMVDALTRSKDQSDLEVRTNPEQPNITVPNGAEIGIEAKTAVEITAKVFDRNEFRISNWSGKLVALANDLFRQGMIAAGTATGQDGIVEWYYEWVSVGDNRTCATCTSEGSAGFRPLTSLKVEPGGGTVCGARCRCVIVLWTKQEVDRGMAESLNT